LPVGKGSIARATKASKNNGLAGFNEAREIPNLLTDILTWQIKSVPSEWHRKEYHNQSIKELIDSIRKFGLIEPVIVRRLKDDEFQLLSGYGRLLAVKELSHPCVTTRVIDGISDGEAEELYHNLHQENNPSKLYMNTIGKSGSIEEMDDTLEENSFLDKGLGQDSSIHELKFKAVTTISKDLPVYLL
jgi:hypothetical protein